MLDGKGEGSVEAVSDLDLDGKQEVEEKLLAVGRKRRVTGRGEGYVPGMTVTVAVCLGTTGWAAGGRGEGAGPEHEGPECPGRRGLRPAETGSARGCRLVWEGAGRLVGRSRGGSEGSAAWPAASGAGGIRQEKAHSGWRSLRAVGARRGVESGKGRRSARVGLRPPEQARSRRPAGEVPCQSMCDVSHNRKCLWRLLGPRPAVKATFPIGHAENPSAGGRQSPCTRALGVCGSRLPRCGVSAASEHHWARPSWGACLASPVLPSFLSPLPPCLPGPGSLQWSPAGSQHEPLLPALYARLC